MFSEAAEIALVASRKLILNFTRPHAITYTYHSFSRYLLDFPLGTAGAGVLFFLGRPSYFCDVFALTINMLLDVVLCSIAEYFYK